MRRSTWRTGRNTVSRRASSQRTNGRLSVFSIVFKPASPTPTATPARSAGAGFPNDDKAIVHVLNRVGFGPRPGDVAKVQALGLQRYVELQLHPERVADLGLEARLADLTTVRLSLAEMTARF